MTRIFSDGAEFKDIKFWTSANCTASTVQKRSGDASYLFATFGSSGYKMFSALSELYFRYAIYIGQCALDRHILDFRYDLTAIARLTFDSMGHYVYSNGSTVLEDSGIVAIDNTWNLIEVHLLIDDAPNGRFEAYVNGIRVINYTGDTKPGSNTTVNNFYTAGQALVVEYNYVDDIALNDTSGAEDNSWCGDEHYSLIYPNDNGDTNDWTGSDGDKVNNYALVDEFPSTGDTDYVKSSTLGQQDMYKLTDFDGTGKTITRIWAECRAKDINSSGGEIKIGFKTGGTVYLCSLDRQLSSLETYVVGDEATINPADSGAWEDADLDDIQFVVECE